MADGEKPTACHGCSIMGSAAVVGNTRTRAISEIDPDSALWNDYTERLEKLHAGLGSHLGRALVASQPQCRYFRHICACYQPENWGTIAIYDPRFRDDHSRIPQDEETPHDLHACVCPSQDRCGVTATPRAGVAGFGQVLKSPPLPSRGRCDSSTRICGVAQGSPGLCGV